MDSIKLLAILLAGAILLLGCTLQSSPAAPEATPPVTTQPAATLPATAPPATVPPSTTPPSTTLPETIPPVAEKTNLTDCSTEKVPDDCYYRIATAKKDDSVCSNIAALNKRDGCYYVVALQTKNQGLCGKISDTIVRDQCNHLFILP